MNHGVGRDPVHVLLELLGGSGHERESTVVDRYDVPYTEEPRGVGGLEGANHYLVAYWQEG